jgi:hypothetical protein
MNPTEPPENAAAGLLSEVMQRRERSPHRSITMGVHAPCQVGRERIDDDQAWPELTDQPTQLVYVVGQGDVALDAVAPHSQEMHAIEVSLHGLKSRAHRGRQRVLGRSEHDVTRFPELASRETTGHEAGQQRLAEAGRSDKCGDVTERNAGRPQPGDVFALHVGSSQGEGTVGLDLR